MLFRSESFNFDAVQDTDTEDTVPNFNATILQELYRIQDMISSIDQKMTMANNDALSILADKLSQAGNKSPEVSLIESLMSDIIQNPDSFMKLAQYSNSTKK